MARRSDFTQKLLDDLRLRKERMGLLPPAQRRSSSSSSGTVTAGSQEIVPFGRSRNREQTIDLSMALAMALSNSGKLPNIEILFNPTMRRSFKFPSLSTSKMGEVAMGVENLNMIIRAFSNGFNLNRDCIEIGRDLLKGAMDLEESLKGIMMIQEASDFMVGSKKKQQVKLLKGKEEEEGDELQTYQGNRRGAAGSKTKFSFIRERRGAEAGEQKKKTAAPATNSSCRSMCEAPAVRHGSHELVRLSGNGGSSSSRYNEANLRENSASEKVRMPNIIAKLMGLEELPAPTEAKSTGMSRAPRSPQLKEMSNKLMEIDKEINNMGKNNLRNSRKPENISPAPKYSLKSNVRNNEQMDVRSMDQEEITITKQKMKARIPEVGNSLTDHSNNARIRKMDVRISGGEEQTARKQSKIDKFVQVDSSVRVTKSDQEQKRNLIISDAKHGNVGKKELMQIDSSVKVTKSSKERFNSNRNDLVNKTGSQSITENIKIIPDGTNIRSKSTHNHYNREKKLIEQSQYRRLPLKSDTRGEKIARTAVMRKPKQIQTVQKVDILKVRKGGTNGGSSEEVTVQNKSRNASQAMEQRSSILEELESRWKERNKKVVGMGKGSDANQELNMQRKNEIISSINLSEDNGNKEITNCNPMSSEDTKTSTWSSPLTIDVNIQASMDQPIQEEINVIYEKENGVYQLPEKSSITMTECIGKCSQEDSTQKYKETQCSFTENKEEDHSRIMQLNSNKSTANEDLTIIEVDQQEVLTKDEDTLKQILITSQNFLNVARSLFKIKIPVDILQATANANPDKDARLVIDCGYELLRRKSKREELDFSRKDSLPPLERSIDILIKEVNSDLESLKYRNYTEGRDYDLADCLNKMIEKDIQHWHPDINCLWDFGWDSKEFVCLEKDEIVRDVEKHVLNGLLNQLCRDLLNVSISIL